MTISQPPSWPGLLGPYLPPTKYLSTRNFSATHVAYNLAGTMEGPVLHGSIIASSRLVSHGGQRSKVRRHGYKPGTYEYQPANQGALVGTNEWEGRLFVGLHRKSAKRAKRAVETSDGGWRGFTSDPAALASPQSSRRCFECRFSASNGRGLQSAWQK